MLTSLLIWREAQPVTAVKAILHLVQASIRVISPQSTFALLSSIQNHGRSMSRREAFSVDFSEPEAAFDVDDTIVEA